MKLNYIVTGAILMALAVVSGAFGAHGLKAKISPDQLEIWEKAVFYQMIQALGMIVTGILNKTNTDKKWQWAGIFFLFGILFFSGSLYLLALREISFTAGISGILGPITPIGGLCFILGWIFLLLAATKIKQN